MSAKILPASAEEGSRNPQAFSTVDGAADMSVDAVTTPETPTDNSDATVEQNETDVDANRDMESIEEKELDFGNAEPEKEITAERIESSDGMYPEPHTTSSSGNQNPVESKAARQYYTTPPLERILEADRFIKAMLSNTKRIGAELSERTRPSPEMQEKINDFVDQLVAGKENLTDRAVEAYHFVKEWISPTPPRPELGERAWKVPYLPPNEVHETARIHNERHEELRAQIIGKRKAFQDMMEFVEDSDPEVVAAELQARAMQSRAEDLAQGSGTGRIILDPNKPPQTYPQAEKRRWVS